MSDKKRVSRSAPLPWPVRQACSSLKSTAMNSINFHRPRYTWALFCPDISCWSMFGKLLCLLFQCCELLLSLEPKITCRATLSKQRLLGLSPCLWLRCPAFSGNCKPPQYAARFDIGYWEQTNFYSQEFFLSVHLKDQKRWSFRQHKSAGFA